jgi:hypothetical protein
MNTAPLKQFGESRLYADNLLFDEYNGMPLVVGQEVYGTWVNFDGRTYFISGKIVWYEPTGFWVESDDGGITPVKLFWQLYFEPINLES